MYLVFHFTKIVVLFLDLQCPSQESITKMLEEDHDGGI